MLDQCEMITRSSPLGAFGKKVFLKTSLSHAKTLVLEPLFLISFFNKREIPRQCEFWEVVKNAFFILFLRPLEALTEFTAGVIINIGKYTGVWGYIDNIHCVNYISYWVRTQQFKKHQFHLVLDRSSHPEVFLGKGVLKICSKFTGEHRCRSVISIKLLCNFIEIVFQYGCSLANFLHILEHLFIRTHRKCCFCRLEAFWKLRILPLCSSETPEQWDLYKNHRLLVLFQQIFMKYHRNENLFWVFYLS